MFVDTLTLSKKHDIPVGHLDRRIYDKGMTEEEAIADYHRWKKRQYYRKQAPKNGITVRAFDKRTQYLGWSVEDAATIPMDEKSVRKGHQGMAQVKRLREAGML